MSSKIEYKCDGCGKLAVEPGDWINITRYVYTALYTVQSVLFNNHACSVECAAKVEQSQTQLAEWRARCDAAQAEKEEHDRDHWSRRSRRAKEEER